MLFPINLSDGVKLTPVQLVTGLEILCLLVLRTFMSAIFPCVMNCSSCCSNNSSLLSIRLLISSSLTFAHIKIKNLYWHTISYDSIKTFAFIRCKARMRSRQRNTKSSRRITTTPIQSIFK